MSEVFIRSTKRIEFYAFIAFLIEDSLDSDHTLNLVELNYDYWPWRVLDTTRCSEYALLLLFK
jgi:hypothetical protein